MDPEKKTPTVLLVGEGNFSFSASLCDSSHEMCHLTATCYESEDIVSKQQLSWRNVQHLRSKGAVVHFGVDATKLQEYAFLTDQLYDKIIFNFPHCGRKAGVKKNRDLLTNFFYRSQEKSFHVVGAVKHVFTSSLPLENVTALHIIDKLTSVQDPKCIDGVLDRGFLGKTSCHPIGVLYKELIKYCEQKLPVNVIEDTFPLTCHNDTCLCRLPYSAKHSNLYFVMHSEDTRSSDRSEDFHKKRACFLKQDVMQAPYSANMHANHTTGLNHLRPSLTCFIDHIIHRSNQEPHFLTIAGGLVFRKCLISPRTMPVYHEILMLLDYRGDTLTVQLQLLMDTIKTVIDLIGASVISDVTETVNNEKTEDHLSRFSVTFHRKNEEDYVITISSSGCDQIIGTVKRVLPGDQHKDHGFLIVALNLDLLAMCLLDIDDWRMLWTEDKRFIEQFHHHLQLFQSFSLYPPYYIHDVSFWVEGNSIFDHVEFHTIALQMSKGNIVDIQLLDQYENDETGKTGLCYRLKYQSCDRALSYRSALAMQLLLRDELRRSLQVILR
ncbi:ferredoxin-fold anticodon-binding domain-containing protein 1 isoform X2 [Rhinoderma darwinii]|uniref:ferredoxin-fold anticodon-binding domain-containing protein 1 isoform X2 n=1 Tax=Rhinoderma darwinii TaxID=43563 RepID=UPI003F67CF21